MLMLRFELVHQNLAVVADHPATHGAVMVLVADDPAAAGVEELIADEAILVLVLVVLPVHDPAARGLLARKADVRGRHARPSFTDGRSTWPANPEELSGACA